MESGWGGGRLQHAYVGPGVVTLLEIRWRFLWFRKGITTLDLGDSAATSLLLQEDTIYLAPVLGIRAPFLLLQLVALFALWFLSALEFIDRSGVFGLDSVGFLWLGTIETCYNDVHL
jgi:hypothetical protein